MWFKPSCCWEGEIYHDHNVISPSVVYNCTSQCQGKPQSLAFGYFIIYNVLWVSYFGEFGVIGGIEVVSVSLSYGIVYFWNRCDLELETSFSFNVAGLCISKFSELTSLSNYHCSCMPWYCLVFTHTIFISYGNFFLLSFAQRKKTNIRNNITKTKNLLNQLYVNL